MSPTPESSNIILCHGCGAEIEFSEANFDNGDPWCDGCFEQTCTSCGCDPCRCAEDECGQEHTGEEEICET